MIKGFKNFITRGNVIDLAVAVVIGTAFTAVVTAIVNSIINPLIGLFYEPNADGTNDPTFTGIYGQQVSFPLSTLLTAIISFFAIALVVYLVFVYPMNRYKEVQAARAGVPDAGKPVAPTETELLVQIRDLLEKQAGSSVSTTPPAP